MPNDAGPVPGEGVITVPKPQRQKVHYTITEALLPENMGVEHAGEFYVAKAEGTVWFVASNGAVVSLTDLLLNAKPVAPPRHGKDGIDGKDGRDGVSIKGDKGDRGSRGDTGPAGAAGNDGRAGRDAEPCQCVNIDGDRRLSNIETRFAELQNIITTVAGKSDAATQTALAMIDSRIAEAKRAVADLGNKQTAFATARSVEDANATVTGLQQQVNDLKRTVAALLSASKRDADYVAYLQEKVRSKTCRT